MRESVTKSVIAEATRLLAAKTVAMEARALFLQARNLFKSLGDVGALAGNELTRRAVWNMRALGMGDDAIAVEISKAVQRALARVSPRERYIVEGREVHEGSHESLYTSLGLGRRQYFRIRRAALVSFARSLLESMQGAHSASSVAVGRDMRMAEALAQYQLGLTKSSLNSLRLALAESADNVSRFDAALALAHLYANDGRYGQARTFLAEARSSLADIHDEQPVRALMLDMLALESARYYNDSVLDVYGEMDRLENRMLGLTHFALDAHDAATVVEALASLAEIRFELAEVERAERVMSACMALVTQHPEIRGRALYRALSAAATISMVLPDGLPRAADYYAQAYRIALDRSALRDGVVAAAHLCSVWRVAGISQHAVAVAPAILDRARRVCAGPAFAGIALDFAAAMLDAGSERGVAPLIAEATTHTRDATFDSSLAAFLKARYLQRQNRLHDALSLVQEALLGFRRAGRLAHEAGALRIQAELQSLLRLRRDAEESVGNALTILTRHGSPHSLERTYRTSAAITGSPEHRRLSDELRAERERVAQNLSGIISVQLAQS